MTEQPDGVAMVLVVTAEAEVTHAEPETEPDDQETEEPK